MEKESIFKKILNFFLHVFLAITSFFRRLFGKGDNTNKNINTQDIKKIEEKEIKKEKIDNTNPTTLPDTANVNSNDHSTKGEESNQDNGNKNNDIILKLTNNNLNKIKIKEKNYIILTEEELDQLINECLEEEYQEEKLKIKEANKILKEKIKEFKEEIIYTIKENIIKKQIVDKENLKIEIKEIIKEEIKVKPLMPKLKDLKEEGLVEKKNHVYFLATPLKKVLNINENEKVKAKPEILVTIPDKKELEKKINEKPYFMVQNVDEVPKEDIKEDLKNAAIVGGMLGAKAVLDLVSPLPKEDKEEKIINEETTEEKIIDKQLDLDKKETPVVKKENILETEVILPKLKELEEQLDKKQEEIKKEIEHKEKLEEEIKDIKEQINKQEIKIDNKEEIKKQEIDSSPTIKDKKTSSEEKIEEKKDNIDIIEEEKIDKEEHKVNEHISDKIDKDIFGIALATASLITSAKKETEKLELEDKEYDKKEEQINKMLNDIEMTILKYDSKMTEKQRSKLRQEQERLRDARENLQMQKQEDIVSEERLLDETIKEIELNGLQNELKKLNVENQIEMNETLLEKINGLESLTEEQIANIDKKMLMKRLNKVSALMEMSSILALPFIRNKYFFFFTIGLIIDNHFNFINAFFRRKINRYKPADLEQIKRGEDALNSALNMTYKNQVQLEYVVNEALARYPELANEPLFTNKVKKIQMQLEHNYQKLMNKKKTMEKYHRKTKSQIKVLKRTGELEEAA